MRPISSYVRGLFGRSPPRSELPDPWRSQNGTPSDRASNQAPASECSQLLAACRALEPKIREFAPEMETGRRLPTELFQCLKREGFFRMTMPKEWGGFQLDPIEQFLVLRALGKIDASVAWCVMIGSDGGFFSGYLDQSVAREMYRDVDAFTGSGIFPAGVASRTSGGFKVTGRWRFGSGCHHADWMAAGCREEMLGVPTLQLNGLPRTRVCMIPGSAITIHDTWSTTGLRGSGSHDWTVTDHFVPESQTFNLLRPTCYRTDPLYRLPGMFMFNFPGVVFGIARRAIEVFVEIASNKKLPFTLSRRLADEPRIQSQLGRLTARVAAAESLYLAALHDIWASLQNAAAAEGADRPASTLNPFHPGTAYDDLSVEQRVLIRLGMVEAHDASIEVVESVYRAAGANAIFSGSPLDRLLRDIHTISSHVIVSHRAFEVGGKMLLGHDPEEPFF